jgi:hypothetical protein
MGTRCSASVAPTAPADHQSLGVGSGSRRTHLVRCLEPAITAYADRSSDGRPERSLDGDRALCIALLCAAGVLQVDIDVGVRHG